MRIKYVSWNYGRDSFTREPLHLIRLADGRGFLRTTSQCRAMRLCR